MTHVSFILPILLAKNWTIGYLLVALGVILGLVVVILPAKRKLLESSPNYVKRR